MSIKSRKNIKMKQIKDLAFQYLTEETPVKRLGILLQVETLLNEYNFKSRSKFLKDFKLSYFASVNSSQKIEKGKKENHHEISVSNNCIIQSNQNWN